MALQAWGHNNSLLLGGFTCKLLRPMFRVRVRGDPVWYRIFLMVEADLVQTTSYIESEFEALLEADRCVSGI